jgi:Zn-finger nucleic acid-binding protein
VLTERMKGEAAKVLADPAPDLRPAPKETTPARPQPGRPKQAGPLYRSCPVCRKMMARRNYARRSGVIVDTCHEHGMWFDSGELHDLLKWIRRGGLEKAAQFEKEEARAAASAARRPPGKIDQMAGPSGVRFSSGGGSLDDDSLGSTVIGMLLKVLFKMVA